MCNVGEAAEIDAAWKQFEAEEEAKTNAAYQKSLDELELERCDSGYYDDVGDEEDPPELTEVNIGDPISPFYIYE